MQQCKTRISKRNDTATALEMNLYIATVYNCVSSERDDPITMSLADYIHDYTAIYAIGNMIATAAVHCISQSSGP